MLVYHTSGKHAVQTCTSGPYGDAHPTDAVAFDDAEHATHGDITAIHIQAGGILDGLVWRSNLYDFFL